MQQDNEQHTQWHVCGLVIQVQPTQIQSIMRELSAITHTEIPAFDEKTGKVVVVMQSDNQRTLLENMENARNIQGVLAVSLVYHQQDLGDTP